MKLAEIIKRARKLLGSIGSPQKEDDTPESDEPTPFPSLSFDPEDVGEEDKGPERPESIPADLTEDALRPQPQKPLPPEPPPPLSGPSSFTGAPFGPPVIPMPSQAMPAQPAGPAAQGDRGDARCPYLEDKTFAEQHPIRELGRQEDEGRRREDLAGIGGDDVLSKLDEMLEVLKAIEAKVGGPGKFGK